MKRALWLLPLVLMGCGGIKNTNPLSGLAGSTDNTRYPFEATTMGWVAGPPVNPVDQVFQGTQVSFYGVGSLGMHVTNFSNAAAAEIDLAFGSAQDLSGKTLSCWIYLPASAAAGDSLPDYAQIAAKDNAFHYANGYGPNLTRDGWTQVTFKPRTNTTGSALNDGQGYTAVGFDPTAVTTLIVKVGVAGAAPASFNYTGVIYVDSIDW